MKKTICFLMALTLLLGTLLGCAAKKEEPVPAPEQGNAASEAEQGNDTASEPEQTLTNTPFPPHGLEQGDDSDPLVQAEHPTFSGEGDIAFVLIYNPLEYSEEKPNKVSTGSIGDRISVGGVRADELDGFEPKYYTNTQMSGDELFKDKAISGESVRAGGLIPLYAPGDRHSFFFGESSRTLGEFKCVFAGENCYVWTLNDSITDETAKQIGTEFDSVIYPGNIERFGLPRYAEEDGKISILCYPMHQKGLGGFFMPAELFMDDELYTEAEAQLYGINLNHAIIHVNTDEVGATITPEIEKSLLGVVAHEFQHLICFTDLFYAIYNVFDMTYPNLWLDEAMSCYASEAFYPRFEEELYGHCYALFISDLVRHGQSLYHFKTESSYFSSDIGAYGASYLFAAYLANHAGDSVFNRIHSYWRTDVNAPLNEAHAIKGAVPETFASEIGERYVYPESIRFETPEAEWLSKLVLDYYVNILSDPENMSASLAYLFEEYKSYFGYGKIETLCLLLYDEINPAEIEGSGRIIVATKDGTFEIPEDADPNLVYIGFDANFQPVTGLIYK